MADRSILVVEDDAVILGLLTLNFEMEGFRVAGASNGDEGLAAVHDQHPDLVITDVMMPKRSGLDLLAAMRGDARVAGIPVILLSAKAQAADVRAGLDAGADDYVTKPFEPDDLVERATRLLDRTR